MDLSFYKGKTVLVTGHTGFKGIWLCKLLLFAGAKVVGYALTPPSVEGRMAFTLSGVEASVKSIIGDIRDFTKLYAVISRYKPEIVFHLAAQPIVLQSYEDPLNTYSTNVMGTVNVLECIRQTSCVKSFVNVTTDKVYDNKESLKGYVETDPLDGYDPYANSKSCSELVTHSYKKSFFYDGRVSVSTARAGNVIGGGDFAENRIIPDCIRAAYSEQIILVRNSDSIRPYQHVLEPLAAYLTIAQKQYEDPKYEGCYNIGPDDCDCITTGMLVDLFCKAWGNGLTWKNAYIGGPHEAKFLKLNCSKLKDTFGWKTRWHIEEAILQTVAWAKCFQHHGNIDVEMRREITEFLG